MLLISSHRAAYQCIENSNCKKYVTYTPIVITQKVLYTWEFYDLVFLRIINLIAKLLHADCIYWVSQKTPKLLKSPIAKI